MERPFGHCWLLRFPASGASLRCAGPCHVSPRPPRFLGFYGKFWLLHLTNQMFGFSFSPCYTGRGKESPTTERSKRGSGSIAWLASARVEAFVR